MIAESFIALKMGMFAWVNPAIRRLVSVAPKNTIPTMVVSQSNVPMIMRVAQNKTSFFAIILPCPWFDSLTYLVSGSVMCLQ